MSAQAVPGYPVQVAFDIHSSRLEDLVNAALDAPPVYGCGYWAKLVARSGDLFGSADGTSSGKWVFFAYCDGKRYVHTNGLREFTLDAASLQSGLRTMATGYPFVFAQFMAGNADAACGDLFLQCCLFGVEVFA